MSSGYGTGALRHPYFPGDGHDESHAPGDDDDAAERRPSECGVVLRPEGGQQEGSRQRRYERGDRRNGRDPGEARAGEQQDEDEKLGEPRDGLSARVTRRGE